MAAQGKNRRRHVRLQSPGCSASGVSGGAGGLPGQAVVADLSESGVQLAFDWPGGGEFPLHVGDSISFMLTVSGTDRSFELMSIVRRVSVDQGAGRACAGVEFCGLEGGLREAVQSAILNLALTKLRARTPDAVEAPSAPAPAVDLPKRSATSRLAKFDAAAPAPAPAPRRPTAPAAGSVPAPGATPSAPSPRATAAPAPGRPTGRRRMYLGEILVQQGAIASEELERFIKRAPGDSVPIGQKLISHGLVDDVTLARALSEQSGLKYVDLTVQDPDGRLAHSLPRDLFTRLHAIPLGMEGSSLLVAVAARPSPMDMEEMERAAGRRVRACITAESSITRWLKKLYNYEAPAKFARARFPVQLRVEYRFLDRAHTGPVHDFPAAGITRELGQRELMIAGPLPAGISPERIRQEGLAMEVDVEGGGLSNQMTLSCRVLSVSSSGYAGEYHLACYIESFPEGGEKAWMRFCMSLG